MMFNRLVSWQRNSRYFILSTTLMGSGAVKLPIRSNKDLGKDNVRSWSRVQIKTSLFQLEDQSYLPKKTKFWRKVWTLLTLSIFALSRSSQRRTYSRLVYNAAFNGKADHQRPQKIEKIALPIDAEKRKIVCLKTWIQNSLNSFKFYLYRNELSKFVENNDQSWTNLIRINIIQ